jgi:hypothetical protein
LPSGPATADSSAAPRQNVREHTHVTIRTHRTTSAFVRPFRLKGIDRVLPPGTYEVITDEELVEGLSFPVYRRVSTMMVVPGSTPSSVEMVTIDPLDLKAAQRADRTPSNP